MRLTDYTDYTLRVLMFCATRPGRPITIAEIAESHAISKNHLMKIVNDLARQGILQTTRGRGGGLRLLKPAAHINIGEVVRNTETDFRMVECFDTEHNSCSLIAHCQLKKVIGKATAAYLAELDQVSLADITKAPPASPRTGARGVSTISVSEIRRAPSRPTAKPKPLRAASPPTPAGRVARGAKKPTA